MGSVMPFEWADVWMLVVLMVVLTFCSMMWMSFRDSLKSNEHKRQMEKFNTKKEEPNG